ncbi:O-antigen/teichoic acid export membrane protein [Acetoanaerobium pronyense]|uniref:O-antigen/teichoic acid export membrane protein n=1 Tax=Acetoanaerobium pronyense TaxID=1482736 RepID=A0ABS4KHE8_9FIRM|nr:oligosaccharide flippase family protein [Acetoanaerobium pronyense]MBP2027209.1 O-antigen/teichoic acid export membrane protein [Acetoanaerobium pronyense]
MSNNIKKDALSSYTNLFVSILAGFIVVPIIESNVGKSYFGIYQFIFTLTAYSELMTMGLGKTVERYVAKFSVEKKISQESLMLSMVLSIYIATALIFLIASGVIYIQFGNIFNFTGDELSIAKICFIIAAISAGLNIPASVFQSFLRGKGKYSFVFNIGTIQVVARLFLVAISLNLGYGIISVFIIDTVLFQGANFVYILRAISKNKIELQLFKYDKELFSELFKYSSFVFLGGMAQTLYWNTDNIILGVFTDTETIAEYALSQRLINYFYRYGTAFSGLFLPKLMEYHCIENQKDSKEMIVKLFTRGSRHQGILTSFAMVNFLILGRDFIALWVGDGYHMTYIYTVIILIPFWPVLTQSTGIEVLYAMKKHKINTIIYFGNAVINVISTIFLVQIIGPMGAAISTGVTVFIGSFVLTNIYYKYLLNMKLSDYFIEVFGKNLLVSGIILVYGHILNLWITDVNFLNFTSKTLMINIVWIPAILFILLDSYDRKVFYKMLKINKRTV